MKDKAALDPGVQAQQPDPTARCVFLADMRAAEKPDEHVVNDDADREGLALIDGHPDAQRALAPVGDRPRDIRYAWQAQGMARIDLLRSAWHCAVPGPGDQGNLRHFDRLLDRAEIACTSKPSVAQRLSGAAIETAWTHLHAAEALVIASCAPDVLGGVLPRATDLTTAALAEGSAQRRAVKEARSGDPRPGTPLLVGLAVEAAHGKGDADHMRARSFRNVVLAAALLASAALAALIVFAILAPLAIPMCTADLAHCVTPGDERRLDVPLVALIGSAAGTLSGLLALRRVRGTSTPYQVPLALALLKVPTGALTAVLGLLVVRAGLGGTTWAADSPAGLLAWAVVLGVAQETLTRLADRQGESVLAAVKGGPRTPGPPPS